MLHLAGAIVGEPSPSGFCALRQEGFVRPELLELSPGVIYSKKYSRYYLPENLLPPRVGDYRVPKARYSPSGLKLRDYQNEGVTFIEHSVKGILLGDDVGIGKCRAEDTYVHTAEFGPVQMCELFVLGKAILDDTSANEDAEAWYHLQTPFRVYGYNETTSEHAWTYVRRIYQRRWKKPLWQITTKRGYRDRTTPQHRFLVLDSSGHLYFKRADSLTPDDYIALPKKIPLAETATSQREEWPRDFTRLAAWWVGDGGGHKRYKHYYGPYLHAKLAATRDLFFSWIYTQTDYAKQSKSDPYKVSLGAAFGHKMEKYGFPVRTSTVDRVIATSLFRAGRETQARFLRHLFTADGTILDSGIVEYTVKECSIAQQVVALLKMFGVNSSINASKKAAKNGGSNKKRTYYRVTFGSTDTVTFLREVGFYEHAGPAPRRKDGLSKYEVGQRFLKTGNAGINPNYNGLPVTTLLKDIRQKAGVGYRKLGINTRVIAGLQNQGAAALKRLAAEVWPQYLNAKDAETYYNKVAFLADNFVFDKIVETKETTVVNTVLDLEVDDTHSYFGGDLGFLMSHNTVQALHYLYENPSLRPFLVVGPLISLGAWCGEDADAYKYYRLNVAQLTSQTPDFSKIPSADGYFITNNILPAWAPWLTLHIKPAAIILDEAHVLSNPRRQDARAIDRLCQDKSVSKRIVMTATPVTNAIRDLWMLLQCAQPSMWGPWVPWASYHRNSFRTRFAAAARDEWGWKDNGESNIEELRYRLSRVLLRRSRFDVRKELPAFERRIVNVPKNTLNQTAYKKYAEAAGSTVKQVRASGLHTISGQTLTRLNDMAKHLSWAKREIAVREILDLINSAWNKKVVVFCWYQRTADYITKQIQKRGHHVFGPVTGKTLGDKRIKLATQFRDLKDDTGDSGSVFVGTLGATGTSLNPLSCASYGLCVDLYWVPRILLQAEGRLHREGQLADVLFTYLRVEDSIDTIMYEHLLTKAKAIEKSVSDPSALSMCEQLGGRNAEESTAKLMAELAELDFSELELF